MKTHIVLHHSLTKDSKTVSWGAIRRYHTNPEGPYKFRDIGYHYGIELVGDYYEILWGRAPDETGAHCRNARMNHIGIGICVVGNYDEIEPPQGAMDKLDYLVKHLMSQYEIPWSNVIGHRDAGLMDGKDWEKGEFKSCPGVKFPLNEFRKSLKVQ